VVAAGERIGPYVVDTPLAQGGVAEILVARDTRTGARVAIKRALPDAPLLLRTPALFHREARIARALDHPHVVRTLDALDDEHGVPVLVMELLEGASCAQLGARLRASSEGIWVAVDIACAAAQALEYLHRCADPETGETGLVHRDVSPDNLFVTRDGVVKLIDFGLAKHVDESGLTRAGHLKGKVFFMSPEQVEGETLDARTDQYSLAATLYWLLTGVSPFEREGPLQQTLDAIVAGKPRSAVELEPRVPAKVNAVLMRALERDRSKRFTSCAELCTALVVASPKDASTRAVKTVLAEMVDVTEYERMPTEVLSRDELLRKIGAAPPDDTSEEGHTDPDYTPPMPLNAPRNAALNAPLPRPRPAPGQLWPAVDKDPLFKSIVVDDGSRALRVVAVVVLALTLVGGALLWSRRGGDAGAAAHAGLAASDATGASGEGDVGSDVSTRRVRLVAPPHVQWSALGELLGAGTLEAELPAKAEMLSAKDARRGVISAVPVADVVDYAGIARVPVSITARPWAEVTLGDEPLGLTPLNDVQVVPGRYRLKVVYGGKEQIHELDINASTGTLRYRF
jgi:serine/threonine protein kinase